MFCTKCGVENQSQARFCASCGSPIHSATFAANSRVAPQSPKKRSRASIYLLVVGLGLLLLVAVWGGNESATPSSTSSTNATEPIPITYKIGQDVIVGYWAYRCMGAKWQNSIGSEYTAEYPDARFLIVDLAIRNNDKTASTLPPVKLVDTQGREFDESSKGVFMENSFGVLKSLNPGVSSRGYIVFDVPPGKYALRVSGGFTSGERATIDLH